jgi:predicted regulator of Ras-like GTPase activity (Roadblock/LC7/MglB family)
MGSLAGVSKMILGMAGQIDAGQMRQVEARLRENIVMICSMAKKNVLTLIFSSQIRWGDLGLNKSPRALA